MPQLQPPAAPARLRNHNASTTAAATTSSSAAPSSSSSRVGRLARGTSNGVPALRSRASLESDGMVSNSDDSASLGHIHLPRRQPVFTASSSASAPSSAGVVPMAAAPPQQQQQQQQQQPHAPSVEQQQRQSSGSSNPVTYDTPTHALRGTKLLNGRQGLRPSSRMSNASNSSFNNFDSPKPRQLAKLVSEAGPSRSSPPQTPRTPQTLPAGLNPDGSHSVIRNDEDANNSGLLDLSPVLTRLGKGAGKAAVLGTPGSIKFGTPTHLPTRLGRADFRPPSAHADPVGSRNEPDPAAAKAMKAEADTGMVDDEVIRQEDESILDPQYRNPRAAALAADGHSVAEELRGADGEEGRLLNDLGDIDEYAEDEAEDYAADFTETLNRLRRWRHDAMQQHLYETAIFWGDKILSLETSTAAYNDAYHLAQCYFYTHQYARAEHLLTNPLRTGASRHAAADVGRSRAERDQAKMAGVAAASAAQMVSEAGEEGDALLEALNATRSQTQLPAAILARSSTKGSMYSTSTCGKRKERGFTTSATGSASSGNESSSSVDDDDNADLHKRHGARIGRRAFEASGIPASGSSDDGEGHLRGRGDPDGSVVIKPPEQAGAGRTSARRHEVEASLDDVDADLIEVKDKEATLPDGPSLVNHSLACRYLAAQCQVRLGKYHEALDLVGDTAQWAGSIGNKRPSSDGGIKLGSSVAFLRGQIYLRLEDLARARESFMSALALDVKNYEAFSALIDGNMLGVEQQWSFVQGLEYLAQAGDEEGAAEDFEFIRLVYTTRLSKQGKAYALNTAAARRRLASEYGLSNNPDVLLGLAEELFSRLRYADAFTVTSRILELSADHPGALPIHIACIYHLRSLRPVLFMLAHRLTELDPESPVSWYAVGTWYATTKRWADARRYFSKASLLDPRFAPSWIAFGHTFAMEGESDQAVTAYSTASRLFPQSHLPRLFIGMEHLHQGNLSLARLSLEGSAQIWDVDPVTANERGVVAYHSNDIPTAVDFFQQALRLAEKTQEPASAWIGTHLNLGLAYRRLESEEEARKSLLVVTELDPHCFLARLTLGMIAHKLGDLEDAIGWYHEALSINPRDQYGTDLLEFALEEKMAAGISAFSESLDPENRLNPAAAGSLASPSADSAAISSPSKGKGRLLSPSAAGVAATPYRAHGQGQHGHGHGHGHLPPTTPQIRFDSPSRSFDHSQSPSQSHMYAARTPAAANRTRQIGELTTAEMSLDLSSLSSPGGGPGRGDAAGGESSMEMNQSALLDASSSAYQAKAAAETSAMEEESFD